MQTILDNSYSEVANIRIFETKLENNDIHIISDNIKFLQLVKEIYAPMDGKPLSIVINPTAPITCHNNGVRSSGLP
jgi:hypothetical protein